MLLIIIKYFLMIAAAACALTIIIFAFRTKRPLRTLFASALGGIIALFAVLLFSPLTGVRLEINIWTIACSAGTGIPGVILMLVMKTVWSV